ncbi:unnamed protein product [Sympodiomycopsis kandeliae]
MVPDTAAQRPIAGADPQPLQRDLESGDQRDVLGDYASVTPVGETSESSRSQKLTLPALPVVQDDAQSDRMTPDEGSTSVTHVTAPSRSCQDEDTKGTPDKTANPPSKTKGEPPLSPVLMEFAEHDPRDPRQASVWMKNFTFSILALNAFVVSSFASAYLFITPQMMVLFGVSRSLVITGFAVYVIAWGPGPLVLAPLSDTIGRKPVYIVSSLLWTLFQVGCARATNITTMIVCRFFAGLFGCASITNGSGSIIDIFEGVAVAKRVASYSAILFLGPVIGPMVGGAVSVYSPSKDLEDPGGFRWLFYAGTIIGVLITVLHFFAMETHHSTVLRHSAKKLSERDNMHQYRTAANRVPQSLGSKIVLVSTTAVKMIGQEPIIVFISLWQTTVLAVVYLAFDAFPVIFGLGHGFNSFQVGLSFLGVGMGMLSACLWATTFGLRLYVQAVVKAKGVRTPEMRVSQGLAGAILAVMGLFWMGYTSYPSVHWIVPILGSFVYGLGALSVMLSTFGYLIDAYASRAAPAFAATGLIRSVVTGVLPLCGSQFFLDLNPRNATLILACIALAEVAIPVAAWKYGPTLRTKSKFSA